MASLRLATPLLGVAALLLCSCGQSGGGGAASSQASASSATPAASSTASDTPQSSAAAGLPPLAAAATVGPAAAGEPQKRELTAAELLREDPAYIARERKLEALYANAKERDPTGQVERAHAAALAERRSCVEKACLDDWFRRREASLRQYVEN